MNAEFAELQRLLGEVRDGSPLPWRHIGGRVDSADRFKVAECLLDEDAHIIAAAVNALDALLDAASERERMREGRDDSPRDEDGWATPGQMWAMLLDSPLNERMALLRAALRAMDAEHRCVVGFHHEAVQQRDALAAKVERVRALHRPAYNDAARSPMCEDCGGKAGVHPCGCWAEDDYEFVCAVCNQGTKNQSVPWPCPTIAALDGPCCGHDHGSTPCPEWGRP